MLVALLVCLAPTTIGALLSAIGIAGMNRLSRANVIAMSGRAVEAAGDVDVLLLDKTGTITLGNRQATRFVPAEGVSERDLAEAAQLASMADETPEGRSIAVLAKHRFGLRGHDLEQIHPDFVPFSAQTRMSGVDLDGQVIRKGAAEAVEAHVREPRRARPGRSPGHRPGDRPGRRHAAGRQPGRPGARGDRAEGHREGRDQGAVLGAAADGHQDRHDHRRQPAHRRGDRRRGGRRRLSWPRRPPRRNCR